MIDGEYMVWEDGKMLTVPEIEKISASLVNRYKWQSQFIERVQKENEELKNGIWEKNEIARLKEENEQYRKERLYSFILTEEDKQKIKDWMSKHEFVNIGPIGGRYEYKFLPTSIGTIAKVVDTVTKEEFKFQDLD